MTTIYNGVDFERFASGRRLDEHRAAGNQPTLLSVSTWNLEEKARASGILIDAMGPITRRCPGARLLMAVAAQHRRYAAAIEARLASRPWRDAVTIVYNRADVQDLLASADVFVYASGLDSLPRALLEAHAAGLPIVTTATAGCSEVVEDGVTGFVVDAEPAAIAERVLALLEDDDARRRLGARGRERVRDLFSWDRMADGYAEVLQAVAAGSGGRAR
jgi:glycosyltransferase involved in cell wall biosynthesis